MTVTLPLYLLVNFLILRFRFFPHFFQINNFFLRLALVEVLQAFWPLHFRVFSLSSVWMLVYLWSLLFSRFVYRYLTIVRLLFFFLLIFFSILLLTILYKQKHNSTYLYSADLIRACDIVPFFFSFLYFYVLLNVSIIKLFLCSTFLSLFPFICIEKKELAFLFSQIYAVIPSTRDITNVVV